MQYQENKKNKTVHLILKTLIYAFAVFGLIFIVVLAGVIGILVPRQSVPNVPDKAVLTVDFNTAYAEARTDEFFSEFTNRSSYAVFDLVRAIYIAADDERIKALQGSVDITSLGLAQIQDIAQAVSYFKSKGKKTYMYSTSMGSFGQGNREYYLASFFDEIWLQPSGEIGLTGINIEVPFFKNILNKLGVEPEFYTRYEYKTAVASFLDSKMSRPYHQELDKLGKGLFEELTKTVEKNRLIDTKTLQKEIDQAPVFADRALKKGLVDKIAYREELRSFLKTEYDAALYDIKNYIARIEDFDDEDLNQIVVMVLEGVIESGLSTNNPLNEAVIGSQTVMDQLEEISKRKNLKALVLRINSPGGSYAASDEIRHALVSLKKKKNIPIVVSMSDYAASGGYFIALPGDWLIAEPATLTGSIGVLGGKVVLSALWKKIGLNWAEIKYGQNAGLLSMNHPFSKSEKQIFNRSLDLVYQDFTAKVMEARHIDPQKIDQIARGRVWLGNQAQNMGLVDELGGFDHALEKARELSGMSESDTFNVVYYPKKESFQEKLTKFIENGGSIPSVKAISSQVGDVGELKLLYRLKHEAVMAPFIIKM